MKMSRTWGTLSTLSHSNLTSVLLFNEDFQKNLLTSIRNRPLDKVKLEVGVLFISDTTFGPPLVKGNILRIDYELNIGLYLITDNFILPVDLSYLHNPTICSLYGIPYLTAMPKRYGLQSISIGSLFNIFWNPWKMGYGKSEMSSVWDLVSSTNWESKAPSLFSRVIANRKAVKPVGCTNLARGPDDCLTVWQVFPSRSLAASLRQVQRNRKSIIRELLNGELRICSEGNICINM